MSDQCEQKMSDIIEGGINERDYLCQEIEQYEHETKVQAKRIKELEEAMQRFVDRTNKAEGSYQVPVYVEYHYDKFKQLLKNV